MGGWVGGTGDNHSLGDIMPLMEASADSSQLLAKQRGTMQTAEKWLQQRRMSRASMQPLCQGSRH